jgi:hypothetical protein
MKNVSAMNAPEKLGEAIRRSLPLVPPESRIVIEGLLTPESLAVLATAVSAWGAAHFFGVGEVASVVLVVAGAAFLGKSAIDVASDLMTFVHRALDAETERDLDVAGAHFAAAVVAVGVNVVAALLLHRTTAGMRARLSKGVAPAARQRLFYRPTITADPTLPPGFGVTNKFGDITYSTRGSATDQALALRHGQVHSAFRQD